jgi:hypothetical protein
MPSIDCQLRRRAGMPRNTSRAKTAPPAPVRVLPGRTGRETAALVAATVLTVADAVPPTLTAADGMLQVGESPDWFAGPPEFSVQVSVTVPLYPLVDPTVIVELAELPLFTLAGEEAVSWNVAGAVD